MHETEFEVISPVGHVVSFNDLNVVELEVAHESSKLGKRLTSRTTHTEKKCITLWLSQDSAYSIDMITCIQEHDKLHRMLGTRVKVL